LTDTDDPFYRPDKAKAISWKGAPIGAKVVIELDGPASKVQARQYDDPTKLDYWDDDKTQPKMNVVLTGMVKGQRRSLWCMIPSNLFFVLGDAQEKAGARFGKGGTLTVEKVGEKPNENPRFKPSNQFGATYDPPKPGSDSSDPWDDGDEPPF